jgi:hypothetical protein
VSFWRAAAADGCGCGKGWWVSGGLGETWRGESCVFSSSFFYHGVISSLVEIFFWNNGNGRVSKDPNSCKLYYRPWVHFRGCT